MRPYRSFFIANDANRHHSKITLEQRLKNVIRDSKIPQTQKENELTSHHLQQIIIINITNPVNVEKTITAIMRSLAQAV